MRVSPHNPGPVPENLHADVAGAVSLRRDVELAELGLFEGGEETGFEGSHTPPRLNVAPPVEVNKPAPLSRHNPQTLSSL